MLLKFPRGPAGICAAERQHAFWKSVISHLSTPRRFWKPIRLAEPLWAESALAGTLHLTTQVFRWCWKACPSFSFPPSPSESFFAAAVLGVKRWPPTAHRTCLLSLVSHPLQDRKTGLKKPERSALNYNDAKMHPEACPSRIWEEPQQKNTPLGDNGPGPLQSQGREMRVI